MLAPWRAFCNASSLWALWRGLKNVGGPLSFLTSLVEFRSQFNLPRTVCLRQWLWWTTCLYLLSFLSFSPVFYKLMYYLFHFVCIWFCKSYFFKQRTLCVIDSMRCYFIFLFNNFDMIFICFRIGLFLWDSAWITGLFMYDIFLIL